MDDGAVSGFMAGDQGHAKGVKDTPGDSEKVGKEKAAIATTGALTETLQESRLLWAKLGSSPWKLQQREERLSALFLFLTYALYLPLQHY